eukprot:scaffold372838_cov15-Prasinocladus_malaysianus.AAC.1
MKIVLSSPNELEASIGYEWLGAGDALSISHLKVRIATYILLRPRHTSQVAVNDKLTVIANTQQHG